MRLRKRDLALAFILCVVSQSVGAEVSKQCREGTSLWIPQENPSAPITKWNGPIGYEIDARQNNGTIIPLVEDSLRIQSQSSGLKVAPGSGFGVDLLIAIFPDISALATPDLRNSVANYFRDYYRRERTKDNFEINTALWDASFRNIMHKCFGATLMPQQVRERAFLAVQQDESAVCVKIGLAEILGLGNLRKYYFEHDRSDPSNLITMGLQTLYEKTVSAGMSGLEASKRLEEICHGR